MGKYAGSKSPDRQVADVLAAGLHRADLGRDLQDDGPVDASGEGGKRGARFGRRREAQRCGHRGAECSRAPAARRPRCAAAEAGAYGPPAPWRRARRGIPRGPREGRRSPRAASERRASRGEKPAARRRDACDEGAVLRRGGRRFRPPPRAKLTICETTGRPTRMTMPETRMPSQPSETSEWSRPRCTSIIARTRPLHSYVAPGRVGSRNCQLRGERELSGFRVLEDEVARGVYPDLVPVRDGRCRLRTRPRCSASSHAVPQTRPRTRPPSPRRTSTESASGSSSHRPRREPLLLRGQRDLAPREDPFDSERPVGPGDAPLLADGAPRSSFLHVASRATPSTGLPPSAVATRPVSVPALPEDEVAEVALAARLVFGQCREDERVGQEALPLRRDLNGEGEQPEERERAVLARDDALRVAFDGRVPVLVPLGVLGLDGLV